MELKCFGGGKCPDWVISGLYSCSKFDADSARTVCLNVASQAAGEPFDEEEIKSILTKHDMDAVEDVHQVLSSILYVLKTCAKWDSDSAQLAAGMRTIRLSNHMVRGLRVAFEEHGLGISAAMRKTALTLTKLQNVSVTPAPDDAVDCVQLNITIENAVEKTTKEHCILVQKDDLAELVSELKKTKKYME